MFGKPDDGPVDFVIGALEMADERSRGNRGNAIELGDARLAMATSQAQQVQAAYALAMARVSLRKALGRSE